MCWTFFRSLTAENCAKDEFPSPPQDLTTRLIPLPTTTYLGTFSPGTHPGFCPRSPRNDRQIRGTAERLRLQKPQRLQFLWLPQRQDPSPDMQLHDQAMIGVAVIAPNVAAGIAIRKQQRECFKACRPNSFSYELSQSADLSKRMKLYLPI